MLSLINNTTQYVYIANTVYYKQLYFFVSFLSCYPFDAILHFHTVLFQKQLFIRTTNLFDNQSFQFCAGNIFVRKKLCQFLKWCVLVSHSYEFRTEKFF